MTNSPNYGFNRNPQFSLNHVSEYLASDYAPQGTSIICAAKFPKKIEVAAYTQIRRPLRDALRKEMFGHGDLDFLADRLDDKARRESGHPRDEALRCIKAVRAFQATFSPRRFRNYEFNIAPRTISRTIEGVKINVTLDALVASTHNGVTNSGGVILLYAFSANRKSIKERLSTAAGLMLWTLEDGQMEPLPRLCMAVDLARQDIVKASDSHARFRTRVLHSCNEAASRWDEVDPPDDYDGPDWR